MRDISTENFERLKNGLWKSQKYSLLSFFFCTACWRPIDPNETGEHAVRCNRVGITYEFDYPDNEESRNLSKRHFRRRKRKMQLEWSRPYFQVAKEGGAYRKILLKALPLVLTRIAYAKLEEALNDTLWREQREFKEWKSKHPYTLTEWMPIGIYGLYKPESK